jgi:hypothetical protein
MIERIYFKVRRFAFKRKQTGSIRARLLSVRSSRRFAVLLGGITGLALLVTAMSNAQNNPPDIRGVYQGTATRTLFKCNNPNFNGSQTFPLTTHIFEQIGGNTRGVAYSGNTQGSVFTGTVSATGATAGTYSFVSVNQQQVEGGTFTGQVTAGVLSTIAVGHFRITSPQLAPITCEERYMVSGTLIRSDSSSDLQFGQAEPGVVGNAAHLHAGSNQQWAQRCGRRHP